MRVRLAVFGATGSIGTQTLDIVRKFKDRFEVVGLVVKSNLKILHFAREFGSKVWVEDEAVRQDVDRNLLCEPEEILERADVVVVGVPGFDSVDITFKAVNMGKRVAVASKESILCTGELLFSTARQKGSKILPVDSEHSALWRVVEKYEPEHISAYFITASGGPLLKMQKHEIENATPDLVLKHPVWNMGAKITVDSAGLVNKAFEIIEASFLFSIPPERIKVKVHPEAVVHAGVEFQDGFSVWSAHPPDMKIPIAYALFYPDVPPLDIDFEWKENLTFLDPDMQKFPALRLGWLCAKEKGILPCVLVVADDFAVKLYLEGKIRFGDIFRILENAVEHFAPKNTSFSSIEDVKEVRDEVLEFCKSFVDKNFGVFRFKDESFKV